MLDMPKPDARVITDKERIVADLRSVLGPNGVIDRPAEVLAYECDALSAYRCPPLAVVLPATTEEVSAALKVCSKHGVPVIPRGAGTSLAGGALPTEDAVVIGVSRMTDVLEISPEDRLIRVQTGVTNLSVTGQVEGMGFFYAPDPSSQLACMIAGNIAMNSGGAHCLKYGVTTNNLLAVKMVLMDGRIVEIDAAEETGGVDILSLVCGSEGQLGIVTEATLRILPKPEGARPMLIAYDSAETAGACVAEIIREGLLPAAIEFMDAPCIRACEDFAKAGYPECEALLIVECEGAPAEIDHQMARVREIAERYQPVEVREATSADEAARIWLGRKSAFGAMGRINDYICLDGTIPVDKLPTVLERIGKLTRSYGLECANVFHAGDGNLHPLILFNANDAEELDKAERMGADILTLCVEVGGCLTGEHGVGVEKRDLMTRQFSTEDLEAQMLVKDVFDPHWLLNPAKVFPLSVSASRREAAQ